MKGQSVKDKMIRLEKDLMQKKKELEMLIATIRERIEKTPKGSLKIAKNKYGNSYYYCNSNANDGNGASGNRNAFVGKKNAEKGNGCRVEKENTAVSAKGKGVVYLGKDKGALVHQLAQKSYDRKVLKWAEDAYEKLGNFMCTYDENLPEQIYMELSESRRALVSPLEPCITEMVDKWNQLKYEGKPFDDNMPYIMTENGERVRSKSEKILADKFLKHGIPYKYEYPLMIDGFGRIYPDFTLLNVLTKKVYYWEHLGMMDNPEYVEKALRKIEGYMQNGIFPGKQLLLTYETKRSGISMQIIEGLLSEYFA